MKKTIAFLLFVIMLVPSLLVNAEESVSIYSETFDDQGHWGKYISGWTMDGSGEELFSYESGGSGKTDSALKVTYDKEINYKNSSNGAVNEITNSMYKLDAPSFSNGDMIAPGEMLVVEIAVKAEDYNARRTVEIIGLDADKKTGPAGRFISFGTDGQIGTAFQASGNFNAPLKTYGSYEPGKWYYIAAEINLGEYFYNLYINGEKVDTENIPLVGYNGQSASNYWPKAINYIQDIRLSTVPKNSKVSEFLHSETYFDNFKIYLGSYDAESAKSNLIIPAKYQVENQVIYLNGETYTAADISNDITAASGTVLYDKNWNEIPPETEIEETCFLVETVANGNVYAHVIDPFSPTTHIYSDDMTSQGNWTAQQKWSPDNSGTNLFSYESGGMGKTDVSLKVTYDKNREYKVGTSVVNLIEHTRSDISSSYMTNTDLLTLGTKVVMEASVMAKDYNAVRYILWGGANGTTVIPIYFGTDGNFGAIYSNNNPVACLKTFGKYDINKWYNIAFEFTVGDHYNYSIYINGEKMDTTDIPLIGYNYNSASQWWPKPVEGISYVRFCTEPKNQNVLEFEYSESYFDDLKIYIGSYNYKTAKSTLKSEYLTVENDTVYVDNKPMTAGELKDMLTCKSEYRIYSDNSFETELSDDEFLPEEAMIAETLRNSGLHIYKVRPYVYFENVSFVENSGKYKVTGNLTNKSGVSTKVRVVVAAFSGDEMQSITSSKYEVFETDVPVETAEITTDENTTSVEAWVIDSWASQKSYSKTHIKDIIK
ncbi:MAG: hypothetical protein IJC74_07070 [Clostridia bacterium]|nr:hypothetical protein [Clostridia bacterium]